MHDKLTMNNFKGLHPKLRVRSVVYFKDTRLCINAWELMVHLNGIWFSNMVTQCENNFFIQDKSLVTCDSDSVSLANIIVTYYTACTRF